MAGSYPDVPSRRFAWDADGSVLLFRFDGASLSEADSARRLDLNRESSGSSNVATDNYYLIFPELREFDGIFMERTQPLGGIEVLRSADTTNGIDGTWTTEIASYSDSAPNVYDGYRTNIVSAAASGIRALRLDGNFHIPAGANNYSLDALHVYGDITPGQTPDRLLFIDEATGLEYTAAYDFGDIPRGGSEDVTWRIKNNSASLTANTIQYTTEDLYLGSGAWYTHTLPGGSSYQSTRQVASLAPATTSGLITTRRITPGDETPGLHAARTYLNVDTWS